MQKELPENFIKRDKLVISSSPDQLELIEQLALDISKQAKFSDEQSDNLAIVLTELVNNAITHGNKGNPEKSVTIRTLFAKTFVEISIKDEGKSFDPDELANPTNPENLWKESGRGIFLVRNLIDEVRFNPTPDGMEIIVREYISKE